MLITPYFNISSMLPARRNFRLLLFLVTALSFLLGMPFFTFALEVSAISDMLSPGNSFGLVASIKIALLIATHIALVSLLFIKETAAYKYYLMVWPMAFLIAGAVNGIAFYLLEPRTLLTWLPYLVCYIFCLVMYLRLTKSSA